MLRCIPVLCLMVVVQVSWAQVVPMTNNECNSAIVVSAGVNPGAPTGQSGFFFTNAGSTQSPSFICTSGTSLDVWFAYTATATGTIIVSTCTPPAFSVGSMNDSVLSVFDGSACPPVTMLGCDDDSCAFMSSVLVPVNAGALYYIRVSGLFGSTGNFYLTITPPATPVTNDECTSPLTLALGANGPYSNAGASNSPGVAASCGSFMSPGYRDVWFSFTPACSGVVTVNTGCNSGLDTVLTAYSSCGGAEIACNDDAAGTCQLSSTITFPGTAGVQYRIRVASWSASSSGTFPINVTLGSGMALAFSSPLGAGSIKVDITGGPPSGVYFLAVTFVAGAYPNGWLYGVDVPLPELQNLLNAGAPFLGSLGSCGQFTIGPFPGFSSLSGLPFYAVALGLPPGVPIPTAHSAAVTYTIP